LQQEFTLRLDRLYSVTGWGRGQGLPPEAVAQFRLDLLRTDGPVKGWNKAFLRKMIDGYLAWGHRHHVPLFLGEFGVHRPCFQQGRGGLGWVEDVLDLAEERGLSYTYHDYHGNEFGLYFGAGRVDPRRANDDLIALFARTLARP